MALTREAGEYLYGFHTIHFSPLFGASVPLRDVIRLSAEAGFDAIGIDLASVRADGGVDDAAAAITNAGLRCSDVLALLVGTGSDLAGTARELGQLAAAVDAPSCIAAVAEPVPWGALVNSLSECAKIVADHGCRLAVEFTPYSALTSLHAATELCAAIGWDRCGLALDALHFFRSNAPWADLTALKAEQIAVVQWTDAPWAAPHSLVDESRHGRLLPSYGGLDLVGLARAIRATGWHGVVSAEILSDQLRASDPATAIPAVYAAVTSDEPGWT